MACAGNENQLEEFASDGTTEQEINAPVDAVDTPPEGGDQTLPPDSSDGDIGETNPPDDGAGDTTPPAGSDQTYHFPQWTSASGISQSMYERVRDYYNENWKSFSNRQYVVMIDLGKRSNTKRFTLFDLRTGTYVRYLTSHGKNSDPNNDGWLDSFSNVEGSKQSSIGYYKTLGTYNGGNGYSLRMDGLSDTNSNAYERLIVVHGASYVNESAGYAGRSWGCPALDKSVSTDVINKIKGGALLVIGTSRSVDTYFKLARK